MSQTTQTIEQGADGVTYRVTRQVVQSQVPVTEYQTQQQQVLTPQTGVQYRNFPQTYAVPVTEYRMVTRLRGWWNPFAQPYWTHEMRPVTRWDYRTANVQIPVTQSQWNTQTQSVQVPVTKYKTVQNEYTSRVAISGSSTTPNALQPGPSRSLTPAVEPKIPVVARRSGEKNPATTPRVASRPATTGISGRYNSTSSSTTPSTAKGASSLGYRNVAPAGSDRYGTTGSSTAEDRYGSQLLQADPPRDPSRIR